MNLVSWCPAGQISDLPALFWASSNGWQAPGEGTLEKHHVAPIQAMGAHPGRPIANRPQVNNLPHVVFIDVRGPQAHKDRSEICPTRR